MWGPLIGAGASLLGNLFSSDDSEDRMAQERALLARQEGIGKQYYEPYINRGNQAQDQASTAYQQMLQNPTTFVDQIMQSYKPSQGYQFRRKNTLDAARNSAAAGGFSGTGYDQMQQGELADGLLGQDMQQYLQNILGVQGAGLQGQQHVANTGYNASGSLADYLGNAIGNQSQQLESHNRQSASNQAGTNGMFNGFLNQGIRALGSGGFSDKKGSFGGPGGFLSSIFGGFK